MKMLQASTGKGICIVWTGAIARLIHLYWEDRNKRRELRCDSAEKKIVASYEGRRWCDAIERELIGDITNTHGSRSTLVSNIERGFL